MNAYVTYTVSDGMLNTTRSLTIDK